MSEKPGEPDSVTGSGWMNPERLLREDINEKGGYQPGKIEVSEPESEMQPPSGGGASSPPADADED